MPYELKLFSGNAHRSLADEIAEHLHVKVGDALGDRVVHGDERPGGLHPDLHHRRHELDRGEERAEHLGREIHQRLVVDRGDDQAMTGKERSFVEEDQRVLVSVDDVGFQLTPLDLTEDAGRHRRPDRKSVV